MKSSILLKNHFKKYFVKGSLSFLKSDILRNTASANFPLMLNIELTNDCNLNCITCPRLKSKRKVGYMDFEMYKNIIDECTKHKKLIIINYHKDGEPLLHPKITDMIKYAKEKDVTYITHLNSNGLVLGRNLAKKLIEAGLDDITISIDAARPETFKKIKGSPHLKIIEDNVKRLIKIRKDLNKKNPFVRVKLMRTAEAENEIKEFSNKWKNLADEVQITGVHDWLGAIKIKFKQELPNRYGCLFLWYTLAINWDGSISICCVDWNSNAIVGNLSINSLQDIWNGKAMKEIRKQHLNKEFNKSICGKCLYWSTGEDMDIFFKKRKEFLE